MTTDWRTIALAMLGGILGWALGKLLDRFAAGLMPYAVIVVLVLIVILVMT